MCVKRVSIKQKFAQALHQIQIEIPGFSLFRKEHNGGGGGGGGLRCLCEKT